MTDQVKQIVEILNKEPFKRAYNSVSFLSFGPEQLLQVLNDVLSAIDQNHEGDIRDEAPEVRTQRTLNALKTFKYTPPDSMDVSNFRQGIVLGEKSVVHPILFYLLTNLSGLQTRAYLAKYLVELQLPLEFHQDIADTQMQEAWAKYKELQAHFKELHQDITEQKQSHSIEEVKTDIKTMEEEKENLTKRVERIRKKVEATPNFEESLHVATSVRKEKERGEELRSKIQQERRHMQVLEQRLQRTRQQLQEARQAGSDSSPDTLINHMQEDNRLNLYLVKEKIPKEIDIKRQTISTMQRVALEPAMGQQDLLEIEREIKSVNTDINRLVEKKMVHTNPAKDKLALFRQQASILQHKKVSIAETLQEKREEWNTLQNEVRAKKEEVNAMGGEVLKGDDFKKYVAKLRTKSAAYKQMRQELSDIRAEHGVLARTESVLKQKLQSAQEKLGVLEEKRGISGFRETQSEMEKVSAKKSEFDEMKHRTLDDMSEMVKKLNAMIQDKKEDLAPQIKELRPLRQKNQELTREWEESKRKYDSVSAGLETNRAQLEQTVTGLREEAANNESRYLYLKNMCKVIEVQLERANNEMKAYTSGGGKKSYREVYTKKIQEQENRSKKLKESQKFVRENHDINQKQMTMWKDLEKILKLKNDILEREKNEMAGMTRSSNSFGREGSQDRLVL